MTQEKARFYWPNAREFPIAAALLLLCMTPLIVALSKPAAAIVLVASAGLLAFFVWSDGAMPELQARMRAFWLSMPGFLIMALLVWLGLSTLWSYAPARGMEYTLHMAVCAFATVLAIHATQMSFTRPFTGYFFAGIILASLWMLVNSALGNAPTQTIGVMRVVTNFNRACIMLALLLPLLAEFARVSPSLSAVAITAAIAIVTIATGTSESAKLAMIAGLIVMSFGGFASQLARFLRMAVPAAILLMPLYAGLIGDLIPHAVHEQLGYMTVTIRAEMWRGFASLVPSHWLIGYGIESSAHVASIPEVAAYPDRVRGALGFGHPHNAPLQAWFELGVIGAALVAALVFLYFHWVASLKGRNLRLALAGGVQAVAIACVSHGAWQVWWYALCALVAMVTLFALKVLPQAR